MKDEQNFTTQNFKLVMSYFTTGITIVLLSDENNELHGMTVNSFNSVSLNPSLVLYSVNKANKNLDLYCNIDQFSINILSSEQQDLSNFFADKNKDLTKFKDYFIKDSVPLLNNSIGYLICKPYKSIEAGDHFVIISEVKSLSITSQSDFSPLIYFNSRYYSLNSFLSNK